jgi:endonuclease/exonuclease/phosphatase family metal-dependent hydrolase
MLVLTWNIQKQVRKAEAIAAAIATIGPDLVTLQEVRLSALATIQSHLSRGGLVHALPSLEGGKGNLVLSRWPLRAHAPGWAGAPPSLPFPELLTGAIVDAPHGPLELITAHMPNGSGHGDKKIAHFRALADYLRARTPGPCVVAGDFNSPQSESEDGAVVCFGGKFKNRGQAWEDAEQAIITGMPTFGMRDVFREKHGYAGAAGDAFSHATRAHHRRFDHIFASRDLKATDIQYEMSWLERGLSDHAALWARFAW